ncbi:MAG: LysR family transcriptional regulator [Myxococcota bacterium]
MDLNAISVFVKVVEAGSFIGAARQADVPKSTVARRVDELEAALGVRLLQRSTRASRPTEEGQRFYERCKQIMVDVDEAAADVRAHQSEPRGRLRVATSVLMAESFLRPCFIEYMQAYPEVELEVFASSRRFDLLADGFDVAIRVGALQSSTHIVRRIALAPQYVCASPEYLASRPAVVEPEDLREHACVLYSPDRTHPRWQLENAEGETRAVAVRGRLVMNSHPVALEACLAGLGIANLPAFVCCEALRSGALVRVLPNWSSATRWLHALYPSRKHVTAALRTFLDFMAERLQPPPWAA